MIMNPEIEYFKIETNRIQPKKGRLLIAEPFLNDAYFRRAIVLITEHNAEGTIGFVLNKPIDINITEVLDGFPDIKVDISVGGPVNTNSLHFLHTMGTQIRQSEHILGNVYWGGVYEDVLNLAKAGLLDPREIKFFLGYSGWNPEQLTNELSANSWLVAKTSPSLIMKKHSDQSWENTLLTQGNRYKMWINAPQNPEFN